MANVILLKRNATAGITPTANSLVTGEVAVNSADGLLFIKKGDGTVVSLNGATGAAGVTGSNGASGASGATGATGAAGVRGGTQYTFSATITDADPGPGTLRYNSATLSAVTFLYIDASDAAWNTQTVWFDSWDDSTSATKGYVTLQSSTAAGTVVNTFRVTGNVIPGSGYYKIPVVYVSGTLPTDATGLVLSFARNGDLGATGINGAAGATGLRDGAAYTFSTTVTDADPGNGVLRYNNAAIASVTFVYIDNLDTAGNTQTAWYDTWDDSTSPTRGYLTLQSSTAAGTVVNTFRITGTVTVAAGYYKIPVVFVSGTLPANATGLVASFSRNGDMGATGATGIGASGATGSTGPQGASGSGATGATGSFGATGATGPAGGATLGANSFTGAQNLQDNELIRAKIRDYSETSSSPTISAGTLTLNLETSNIFTVSLNAAFTLAITNPPASGSGGAFTLILTADGTARSITWGSAVKWPGGTPPTLTSTLNKVDIFTFVTTDAGASWYGFNSGQNF